MSYFVKSRGVGAKMLIILIILEFLIYIFVYSSSGSVFDIVPKLTLEDLSYTSKLIVKN